MNFLKNIFVFLYRKPSIVFFIFLFFITIDRGNRWKDWDERQGPFFSDVQEYYAYLPYHMLGNTDPGLIRDIRWNKRSIGMAVMYSPFFAAGHLAAKIRGETTDGFSGSYQEFVHLGTLFYFFMALWICRKTLLKYFSETVVCICLVILVFATNLFYYAYGWGEMPHVYLFFLYALFIHYSLKWIEKPQGKNLFISAFILGMITLIRPPDILIGCFPLLFNVNSLASFIDRIRLIVGKISRFCLAVFLFFIPIICQLLYLKITQGKWVVANYHGEGFFFSDPQIVNFLFSYRKGWLIYTPVMIFSLIGMILSFKYRKDFFLVVIIYFSLTVYVLSCWWDWAFGGSFGCRALVQSYALLVFPLAVFIDFFWSRIARGPFLKYGIRIVLIGLIWLFVDLNMLQSGQFRYNLLSSGGMNKQAYWYMFRDENVTKAELDSMSKLVTPLDFKRMIKGDRDQ
ncbi:MAG: hypothetical protein K0S33_838 [Bacteroidetes bacterium]|jgi:hypothetical protein|nr:hypothetical protein [Bacteroidota bacterium]